MKNLTNTCWCVILVISLAANIVMYVDCVRQVADYEAANSINQLTISLMDAHIDFLEEYIRDHDLPVPAMLPTIE